MTYRTNRHKRIASELIARKFSCFVEINGGKWLNVDFSLSIAIVKLPRLIWKPEPTRIWAICESGILGIL